MRFASQTTLAPGEPEGGWRRLCHRATTGGSDLRRTCQYVARRACPEPAEGTPEDARKGGHMRGRSRWLVQKAGHKPRAYGLHKHYGLGSPLPLRPHDQPNLWHLWEIFSIMAIPLEDGLEFTSRGSDPVETHGERMTLCRPV
jgi:hypothetical protein